MFGVGAGVHCCGYEHRPGGRAGHHEGIGAGLLLRENKERPLKVFCYLAEGKR
jgi:hypothetical protein